MKKTIISIVLVALVLLSAAFGLKKITQINTQKEHIKLMETLLPNGKDFKKLDCSGEDEIIKSVHQASAGYVIETVTEGYSDEIVMLVGVDNDGVVTGLVVHRAHETEGLGNEILTDHKFLAQFLNKSGSFTVGVAEDDALWGTPDEVNSSSKDTSVDGISGATVSSKAVARSVNAAVAYVTGADIESSATSWGG